MRGTDFDVDFHRAIIFEEFDVGQYNMAMLKRLCEGRNYSYPVSRTRDRTMKFCGPIIFVSPDDTYIRSVSRTRDRTMKFCGLIIFVSPDDTYIRSAAGEAFRRRLFVVHAAVPCVSYAGSNDEVLRADYIRIAGRYVYKKCRR
ncbi:hypothetical protein QE152_g4852 [Popillia japonica]|uniref:Uncharacterized protein n=1 Tax=Popillia japonica TaxID=7064 RepID=A0AAW1MZL8_POPJA